MSAVLGQGRVTLSGQVVAYGWRAPTEPGRPPTVEVFQRGPSEVASIVAYLGAAYSTDVAWMELPSLPHFALVYNRHAVAPGNLYGSLATEGGWCVRGNVLLMLNSSLPASLRHTRPTTAAAAEAPGVRFHRWQQTQCSAAHRSRRHSHGERP